MRFLICTVDIDPCPTGSVASMSISDAIDWPSLGVTPSEILYVYSWGFAAVLTAWMVGYGVSLAIGLIRKL